MEARRCEALRTTMTFISHAPLLCRQRRRRGPTNAHVCHGYGRARTADAALDASDALCRGSAHQSQLPAEPDRGSGGAGRCRRWPQRHAR
jgi:hypothetical protein